VNRLLLGTLAVALTATTAAAEEIRVMSAGAVEPGLLALASAFERQSGHTVTIRFGTSPQLSARLGAGESADVLIAPVAVVDGAAASSSIDPQRRVVIGRVGVGVVIRRGLARPDVSSADALRRSVLAADAVVYNRASTGQYVDRLFDRMGIAGQLREKAVRVDTGEDVIRRLATGSGNELGLAAIPEIRLLEAEGVLLVAPLPTAIQNFTTYEGTILRAARVPALAAMLLDFLTTPDARRQFADAGIERPD